MFQVALAASVVLLSSGNRPEVHDDLEPCEGLFSSSGPEEPYHMALRAALLGEHAGNRECQVLAIPSFEEEWAVYLLRQDDRGLEHEENPDQKLPPTIVFKRLKVSLWHAMNELLEGESLDGSYSLGSDAQSKAIERLTIEVDRYTVPVSDATAEVLDRVWDGMLERVRYRKEVSCGLDGVNYYVAHSGPSGCRCGETWSPSEGTRTEALVQLAEAMCALAESPPVGRPALEDALATSAQVLAKRLEQLKETDRDH